MTGALRLSFEHECGYNLFTAPVNWVRNWLRQKALCYAVRAASNRRSTMSPGVALDLDAHISLTSRLDNDKQRDMLMIQAGGLWTASSMHKAGFLATPTCPWCRCAPETLQHLWWECESFQEQRTAAFVALRGILWQELPSSLTPHGIPAEVAADLMGPMWLAQHRACGPESAAMQQGVALDLQGRGRVALFRM